MSDAPWRDSSVLAKWSIVGMNHYYVNGKRKLYVAMMLDGFAIQEEGDDDQYLWNRLWHKAAQHDMQEVKVDD